MPGPLPSRFFDSVTSPERVDSWLVAFAVHVDTLQLISSRPTVRVPELLVSPFLLSKVSDSDALFDELFALGVRLEPYPTADPDLVDLVDATGLANLLYLPPPPYCARTDVVSAHNVGRWEGSGTSSYPPLHPRLPEAFVEAYMTFLADGLPFQRAWDLARHVSPW